MSEALTDESVARYLGCSAEQVRVMRLHKMTCKGCEAIHPSYPSIWAFHHPLCEERKKCALCGGEIDGLFCEHLTQRVGAICAECYGSEEEGEEECQNA